MSVGEFWPEKFIQSCTWELNHRQNAPEGNSGNSVVNTHGESYWTMNFSVAVPTDSPYVKIWSSFFRRRQGAVNTFTANRPFQSFPTRGGFDPLTPPTIDLLREEDGQIRISNHGEGRVTEGDMFGYFTANSGFYVGEIESIIRNTGAELRFHVSPRLFPAHETTPSLRFIKPLGEFRLDGQVRPTEAHDRRIFSARATQVIRG